MKPKFADNKSKMMGSPIRSWIWEHFEEVAVENHDTEERKKFAAIHASCNRCRYDASMLKDDGTINWVVNFSTAKSSGI